MLAANTHFELRPPFATALDADDQERVVEALRAAL